MAIKTNAPVSLIEQHVPEEVVTPDFMLRLILETPREWESRNLLVRLVRWSLRKILGLIQEFSGHPGCLDNAPGNHSRSDLNSTDALAELLSYSLGNAARFSIVGVPLNSRLRQNGAPLCFDDWWSRDAPSLPLALPLLWARSLAWHIFWLLIHDGQPSPAV